MDPKKAYESSVQESIGPHVEFYDPSKESIWTRLGVNFESFKRAPGTTG
jgi:amino acid transporter